MTTVVAPVRRSRVGAPTRARAAAPTAPHSRRRSAPRRAQTRTRTGAPAAATTRTRARAGVAVAVALVFVLVSAVLFHVVLAQGQLELDELDSRIAAERTEYEKRRLEVSTLSSPQRIIEQAQGLGFEIPPTPPVYIQVEGATVPAGSAVDPATTLGGWEDVKPLLGDTKP